MNNERTAADTTDLAASFAADEATALRTHAAREAVKRAWGEACGFALAVEGLDRHSPEDRETAREMAERDEAPTARALAEAERLLSAADPLGAIDDEELLAGVLRQSWELYRTAQAALRPAAAAAVA